MGKYREAVNLTELFDMPLRREFLKAYKSWGDLCRPHRIVERYCSKCPLDGSHQYELCSAMQEIGRQLEKAVTKKIREIEAKPTPIADDYKEFLTEIACPGPDLYQSLKGKANET